MESYLGDGQGLFCLNTCGLSPPAPPSLCFLWVLSQGPSCEAIFFLEAVLKQHLEYTANSPALCTSQPASPRAKGTSEVNPR